MQVHFIYERNIYGVVAKEEAQTRYAAAEAPGVPKHDA